MSLKQWKGKMQGKKRQIGIWARTPARQRYLGKKINDVACFREIHHSIYGYSWESAQTNVSTKESMATHKKHLLSGMSIKQRKQA